MAFVQNRSTRRNPAPRKDAGFALSLSDVGDFLVQSVTAPITAAQKNIEATTYLLQGDFSKANEIGKEGLKDISAGISASLQPLVYIDQEVKKIVPEEYRQFAIGPAEVADLLVTDPEQGLKEVYKSVRFASAKPIYELSGKLFGYDNAAYLMPFDVKPSDVGIKEGTPEAMEFMQKRDQTADVVMNVVGTIYPYVGVAWALYSTAKTVEEQEKAKKLLDESMMQAQIEMEGEREAQRAALQGQQDRLNELQAQLSQIQAQREATNAQIEQAAQDKENITTPRKKAKAVLTVGAAGALAAYLLTA